MNFSKDSLDVTLRDEVEISQEQGNPRFLLTAWEKWMVEKEKKDREKRRYLLQKKVSNDCWYVCAVYKCYPTDRGKMS
jgi:hypothetical protein